MENSLPESWVETTLSVIADWGSGGTPKSTEPKYYNGNIPWLIIGDLNDSEVTSAQKSITQLGLENSSAKIVPVGSILCAMYGSIGKLGIAKIPCATNQAIAFTQKIHGGIPNKYLFYYLFSIKKYLLDIGKGGTQQNISQTVLKEVPFPLAPLPEQHRIVAKLDELMEKTERSKKRLEKIPLILKRFRQSVLAAAVSGKLTEEWREKNNISEEWEEKTLRELTTKLTYGSSQKSELKGKVPVLRMGNIQEGKIDWTNLKYSSDADEIKKYKLEADDVLFNRTNSPELVGKTAIYRNEQPAIYAGYLIKIKTNDKLNPEYLNLCLNTSDAREWCNEVKTDGVSQSNINAQKLAEFIILTPSVKEQHEIVRRVEALFAFADKIETRYTKAKAQFDKLPQALLGKAFRGELVEQDAGDESAGVLLERIGKEKEKKQNKKIKNAKPKSYKKGDKELSLAAEE